MRHGSWSSRLVTWDIDLGRDWPRAYKDLSNLVSVPHGATLTWSDYAGPDRASFTRLNAIFSLLIGCDKLETARLDENAYIWFRALLLSYVAPWSRVHLTFRYPVGHMTGHVQAVVKSLDFRVPTSSILNLVEAGNISSKLLDSFLTFLHCAPARMVKHDSLALEQAHLNKKQSKSNYGSSIN